MWSELVEEYDGEGVSLVDHNRSERAGDRFAQQHRIIGQPGMVVYDADGELVHAGYGPYTGDDLREFVESYVQ